MRMLILLGCGIVAAGMSGGALAAGELYTNQDYCFSALKPAGMSLSTVRQGAQFNFGTRCNRLDELGCDFIFVYAMYFFQEVDLLADETHLLESEGWVAKPDDDKLFQVKGWSHQMLLKGNGAEQTEAHVYARPLRRSRVAEQSGLVLAVGYRIIAEFKSSERERFSKSVPEVLRSWRVLEGCDPFKPGTGPVEQ